MAWMKMGTRLTLAFAVLVALMLALGAMAVERVRRVHAALDEVSRVHSAALQLAARGLVYAQRSATLVDEALLADDRAQVQAALSELDRNRAAADRLYDEVEAVIRECPARAAFDGVLAARLAYRRAFVPARAALLRGAHAQAKAVVLREVIPARRVLNEAWQAFMDAERAAIRADAAVGQAELTRARRDLGAAVLVAGLTGVGLALAVVRPVGPALERAVRAAREMAAGDLRHPVELTRGDELGQLQEALGALQAQLAGVLRAVQGDADALDGSAARLAGMSRALSDSARNQAEAVAEAMVALHRVATGLAHDGPGGGAPEGITWDEVRNASRLMGQLDAEVRRSGQAAAEVAGAGEALSAEARGLRGLLEGFQLPAEAQPVELEVGVAPAVVAAP